MALIILINNRSFGECTAVGTTEYDGKGCTGTNSTGNEYDKLDLISLSATKNDSSKVKWEDERCTIKFGCME